MTYTLPDDRVELMVSPDYIQLVLDCIKEFPGDAAMYLKGLEDAIKAWQSKHRLAMV